MHLAVADNAGAVTIREISFEPPEDPKLKNDLNKIIKTLKGPKEWVECMLYNPSNDKLAVGSHDNNIYVYNCNSNYALFATLKAH